MSGMYPNPQHLLKKEDCILLIIDVQEKLLPAIHDGSKVTNNIVKLIKFANIIELPIIISEQQKLGATIKEVSTETQNIRPITKIQFDCFLSDQFVEQLHELGKKSLIIAGVESHICVAQTALHALPHYTVHVVSDATSSRSPENKAVALKRMQWSGVTITSTEMAIYELLKEAGTDEFRAALALVK